MSNNDNTPTHAALVAAAPDMYRALREIYQRRAPAFNFDFTNAPDMQMVLEALKKAERNNTDERVRGA